MSEGRERYQADSTGGGIRLTPEMLAALENLRRLTGWVEVQVIYKRGAPVYLNVIGKFTFPQSKNTPES